MAKRLVALFCVLIVVLAAYVGQRILIEHDGRQAIANNGNWPMGFPVQTRFGWYAPAEMTEVREVAKSWVLDHVLSRKGATFTTEPSVEANAVAGEYLRRKHGATVPERVIVAASEWDVTGKVEAANAFGTPVECEWKVRVVGPFDDAKKTIHADDASAYGRWVARGLHLDVGLAEDRDNIWKVRDTPVNSTRPFRAVKRPSKTQRATAAREQFEQNRREGP